MQYYSYITLNKRPTFQQGLNYSSWKPATYLGVKSIISTVNKHSVLFYFSVKLGVASKRRQILIFVSLWVVYRITSLIPGLGRISAKGLASRNLLD